MTRPILPHAEPDKPHRVERTDWWFVKQWPIVAGPGAQILVLLPDNRMEPATLKGQVSLKWWLAEADR